jgi:hypothetical protein
MKATGGQRMLVEQFPPDRFRNAEPNDGYLVAAALMRERAIAAILTLNFDLAAPHALAVLGAREDVTVVEGPLVPKTAPLDPPAWAAVTRPDRSTRCRCRPRTTTRRHCEHAHVVGLPSNTVQ